MQVDDVYMSFWPKSAAKAKTDIKIGQSHEAVFPSSYKVDVRLEARAADNVIRINKLDEKNMKSNWLQFQQQPNQYNMRKSNCSTVVASMLELGSAVAPNHTPSMKISEYAGNPYLRWMLKLRFMGNYIEMWTPNDVGLYALQIKSQLGA